MAGWLEMDGDHIVIKGRLRSFLISYADGFITLERKIFPSPIFPVAAFLMMASIAGSTEFIL